MMIKVTLGELEHLDDCVDAVRDSEIGKYFDSDQSAREFLTQAMQDDQLYVGLGDTGEVLGFVKYVPRGGFHRFPYIHVVAIKRIHRQRGVGTHLLKGFEREVLQEARRVFLLVAEFNTRAQGFYLKNGYKEIGRIPDFYRDGVTEIIMMKVLAGNP